MESAPDPATSPPPPPSPPAGAAVKKPAWNIPASLNGPIETGPPVIDESSWPALSESAKSPVGTTTVPSSSSSSSSSSKPQFQTPNPNPNSPIANPTSPISNPNSPSRSSKPIPKRPLLPSTPNPISPPEIDQNAPARLPHTHTNPRPRGGYNGNNPRPRGGSHTHTNTNRGNNNNNGGSNSNSNSNNSSNNNRGGGQGQYRNLSVGGYGVPPVYVRPGPLGGNVPAPFIAAAPPAVPVRPPPFGPPIVYPEMPPSPVYYVPAPGPVPPFVPAGAPVFLPPLDPQRTALLKQIDYYFSADNLCKDTWLRGQMDEQGFVPVSLIANFNKVKQITISIPFILETLHLSYVVEVQGDKIRRKGDWMNWLLRPAVSDNLTALFQNVKIEGSTDQNPNFEITEINKPASEIPLGTQEGEKNVDEQN